MALVVGRIHQEIERHLEGLGDLMRRNRQAEARRDEGHHRQDAEAGAGLIGVEIAGDIDMGAGKADFLLGLAQGRLGRGLARVDLAARKGDLARMGAEMVGAAGQQHMGPVRMLDDRHQHGGGPERRPLMRLDPDIRVGRIEIMVAPQPRHAAGRQQGADRRRLPVGAGKDAASIAVHAGGPRRPSPRPA